MVAGESRFFSGAVTKLGRKHQKNSCLRVTHNSVIYPSFMLTSNPIKLSSTKLGLGEIASLVSS